MKCMYLNLEESNWWRIDASVFHDIKSHLVGILQHVSDYLQAHKGSLIEASIDQQYQTPCLIKISVTECRQGALALLAEKTQDPFALHQCSQLLISSCSRITSHNS